MIVAVVGSRSCGELRVEQIIQHIPANTTRLVSGGAEGVDKLAEEAARLLELPITVIEPDYARYGALATVARNRKIVEESDLVMAFWDFHSKGTAHTLDLCVQSHRAFRVVPLSDPDSARPFGKRPRRFTQFLEPED